MLANLAAGNEAVVKAARAALEVAEDAGDQATADLMTQRVSIGEKAAWMLRAHLAQSSTSVLCAGIGRNAILSLSAHDQPVRSACMSLK
jgi:hypothetical protein